MPQAAGVHRHPPEGLDGVRVENRSRSGGQALDEPGNRGEGREHPDFVVGRHAGHEGHVPTAQVLFQGPQVQGPPGVDRDPRDPAAPRLEGARGLQDRGVLDRPHDQPARARAQAPDEGQVVALGAPGREDDLVLM